MVKAGELDAAVQSGSSALLLSNSDFKFQTWKFQRIFEISEELSLFGSRMQVKYFKILNLNALFRILLSLLSVTQESYCLICNGESPVTSKD